MVETCDSGFVNAYTNIFILDHWFGFMKLGYVRLQPLSCFMHFVGLLILIINVSSNMVVEVVYHPVVDLYCR